MARHNTRSLETFPLASDPRLARVRRKLESFARNSIRLWPSAASDSDIPTGATKLGGQPDLPAGVEWPRYHVKAPPPSAEYRRADPDNDFLPKDGIVSLPFVGQFRLEDLAPYDRDKVLPPKGMLYLFYNCAYYSVDLGSERVDVTSSDPFNQAKMLENAQKQAAAMQGQMAKLFQKLPGGAEAFAQEFQNHLKKKVPGAPAIDMQNFVDQLKSMGMGVVGIPPRPPGSADDGDDSDDADNDKEPDSPDWSSGSVVYDGVRYDLKTFGETHPERVRVLFIETPGELVRRDFPANLPADTDMRSYRYQPCTLTFTMENLLPPGEDGIADSEGLMLPNEYKNWIGLMYDFRANHQVHHMLGYPDIHSHGPSIPWNDFPAEERPSLPYLPTPEQQLADGLDHRVLLQISQDIRNICGMDLNHRIFFCMRGQDLARRDFSRVWIDTE
ncbi:MAG: DUF1963 domain-containing protein [Candidatus Methylacidiphilales bacterium]|nr:DUF1963 domain-containing protein [Candidatus Methylacidiphilales bacterium]